MESKIGAALRRLETFSAPERSTFQAMNIDGAYAPMTLLTIRGEGSAAHFDAQDCARLGAELHDQYVTAAPFPHIVMDKFIDPAFLASLKGGFPDRADKSYFDRSQERLKYQFSPLEVSDPAMRNLLEQLNSQAFLEFLEALTGIQGLVPDPYYMGGGLHETLPGGHLSVHADFNIHAKLRLERRINFLLYLNEDWEPEFGGNLELWDTEMTACRTSVAPVIGRAVVFNTTLNSFHGHPEPLTCPPGRSRRSIATYYYTAPEHGVASIPKRTTIFKPRKDTGDRRDVQVGFAHFVNDWVPFRLQPIFHKIGGKLL